MVRRRKPLSVMGRAVKVPYEFLRDRTSVTNEEGHDQSLALTKSIQ
jgi:hypothetical protein